MSKNRKSYSARQPTLLRDELLSKDELASALDVCPDTIGRWERDPTKEPVWGKTYVGRKPFWVKERAREWVRAGGINSKKQSA
jgi:hypothetical protein